ncbi:uncharacterized protein LOC143618644 [Bidens hawaiensis]|uniref:uncharacterized protein LOC143618644 n=1 Tax=Bidens hawaiensis TaxID=980011 RepID=UPI004049B516
MENIYGLSNSNVHKRSSLQPIGNYALQIPYNQHLGHVDMVDQCLLHDVHSQNYSSPNVRYFQSGRPPVSDHRSIGNMSVESRMPRSPLAYSITPMKLEEDVVVFDGVVVNNGVPVDRARSSSVSLGGSGGSSSSSGKGYKTDVCLSYMQTSGFCRYGSKCQFAHGNKELNPVPFAYKNMVETPCKSYSISGTCAFGSKCRFLHHETSTSPSAATTRAVSHLKPVEPTSSIVNVKTSDWSPADDGIETQLKEDVDSYINKVLYGPQRTRRLEVFNQICSE